MVGALLTFCCLVTINVRVITSFQDNVYGYSEISSRYRRIILGFHKIFRPTMIFAPASVPILIAVGLPQFSIFINTAVFTARLLSMDVLLSVRIIITSTSCQCLYQPQLLSCHQTPKVLESILYANLFNHLIFIFSTLLRFGQCETLTGALNQYLHLMNLCSCSSDDITKMHLDVHSNIYGNLTLIKILLSVLTYFPGLQYQYCRQVVPL